MKYSLFLLAMLCLSLSTTAQVQFGAKAIIGTSLTQAVDKDYADITNKKLYQLSYQSSESRAGLGLSLFAQNDLLFLNVDGMYTTTGRQFALSSTSFTKAKLDPGLELRTEEKKVRLVVNSGVKIGQLKLGIGPELSLITSYKEDFSELNNISMKEPKYNTGFNFMVGYMLNDHLHVDLRHTFIFQDVTSEYYFQGEHMDMRKNPKYLELAVSAYF